MRTIEARQYRCAKIANGKIAECAAGLASNDKPRNGTAQQGSAKAASVGELVDKRVGQMADRAVDEDLIVGRALGPALRQRAFDDFDALHTSLRGQLVIALERDDVEAHG